MKQYKRSQEKKLLHSIFNDTMVNSREANERITTSRTAKTGFAKLHRKPDGKGEHQSGGSGPTNWLPEKQCEPSSSRKRQREFGLFGPKRGEHRSHSGNESKENEELTELSDTLMQKRSS
jgi:hypothetical protein